MTQGIAQAPLIADEDTPGLREWGRHGLRLEGLEVKLQSPRLVSRLGSSSHRGEGFLGFSLGQLLPWIREGIVDTPFKAAEWDTPQKRAPRKKKEREAPALFAPLGIGDPYGREALDSHRAGFYWPQLLAFKSKLPVQVEVG